MADSHMTANELRRAFTEFFEERAHVAVPSAGLIPQDPTLLFTNSGMVPFKPYFVGDEPAPYKRATTVQKCVRAGGKHNDLDEVGRTSRHLTFFEMMGNFSFGDYFKSDAIPMAWDFFTEVLGLDPERLWVTVHETDDEAADIWRDQVGVPAERIQRLDEDNWWRMADTGPNGPCSEIFWDKGPEYGPDGGPLNPDADERFVEIWNLVFMQFDQQADGTQVPLPAPSIDTGVGLERLLAVVQGVDSLFAIDEMAAIIDTAAELAGVTYGADERTDVSLRILAEHARTMTFLISDGVFPTNEARGYVLRRIMRRAIRHAYLLGVDEVVTPALVDRVVEIMGDDYPELVENHEYVRGVVEREEQRFRETLRTGSALLDTELAGLGEGAALAGDVAFLLHDTYGFPLEVTEEIARERGIEVDRAGFERDMAAQRERARESANFAAGGDRDLAPFQQLLESSGPTEFVGRDRNEDDAVVLYVDETAIVLDRTPFYAEAGGQVGDTGSISAPDGRATISDTVYVVPGLHLQVVEGLEGTIEVGQRVHAAIDGDRRAAIRRNHTATHILHWALRKVIGDHVKQQGSLVAPDRLRFDFSHYEALTGEQIAEIEDLANAEILDNESVRHFETSMDHARELGAIAFFGDKYGDVVRVLEAGRHSVELCGGTHVRALGDIGPIKIVSEGSIGANIRRIEAVAGTGPLERLRVHEARLDAAAERLGVPGDDLLDALDKRLDEMKALRDELKSLRQQAAAGRSGELADEAVDGVVVARVDGLARNDLRDLAVTVRGKPGVQAVVLGSAPEGGGVALVAAVTDESGLDAAGLIADAAKAVKGGGGKGSDLATAGGKDPEALDDALELARRAAGL